MLKNIGVDHWNKPYADLRLISSSCFFWSHYKYEKLFEIIFNGARARFVF